MYSVQVINKRTGELIDQVHCPQQLLADHVAEMIDRHVDHAIFMVRVRAPGGQHPMEQILNQPMQWSEIYAN